jgi:hypothetical protein
MKILIYTIITIAFLLITFFGLGPVVFADGSMSERLWTLLVVLLLYFVLGWITLRFIKFNNSRKK